MGSLLLAALWAALKISQRKNPFTKQTCLYVLPVLVYIGWNILCYIFAPLHTEAAEEFIRFLLYGTISLLAACEFNFQDIKLITKWILVAVWISFLYAAVQIIDGFFPGVDPMPWRGFFTKRIFSTHANPNFFADFVIFSSCILGGVYLANRQKKYLFLGVLGVIALFFTESKGAWLAYTAAAALGVLLYTNFCAPGLKKHRLKINLLAVVAALGVSMLSGVYTAKRFQSVSFRLHTWQGAMDIVKDHPVMGVGVGNFKTVYTAYRHPQIFYIESSHNVETQHAENELIEQAVGSGIVGLLIFLGLIYYLFSWALRTLRKNNFPPEQQYYLLGYTTALGGMLTHSLVDISVRFASSGFFLSLFMGFVLALCRPFSLQENAAAPAPATWVLRAEQTVLTVGLIVLAGWILRAFYEVTSVLKPGTPGETILIILAWAVFALCVAGACFIVVRAGWLLRTKTAVAVFILLLPLEFAAYAPFQANHYYSLGVTFNNLGNLDGAVSYFTKAVRFNPWQAEYRQFRANVFTVLLDLTKRFSPSRGDTDLPSDDYTRARTDFAVVERRSPNHPLLYHNRGQLYYKMALTRSEAAGKAHSPAEYELFRQEALENMDKAKASFARALQSDPTNPETYVYLVQIGLLENNLDDAQAWIDAFTRGPKGVTEEEFLAHHQNYPPMRQLQTQVNKRRAAQQGLRKK